MKIFLWVSVLFGWGLLCSGCSSSGNNNGGTTFPVSLCTSSITYDSTMNMNGTATLIDSAPFGTYRVVTLSRRTAANTTITQDFMLHEPAVPAKGFLVLIAGGQLNAGITGTNNATPTSAGGNFLVRSAHLFAGQGFRVMTIDRPDDFADYLGGNFISGYAYDGYRISPEHAVDLSELINLENTTNLPVIIAGTSRGAISAVAQHRLAASIALSSPVTSGANGSPVTGTEAALVGEPTYVLWHHQDGCGVTDPADSASLVGLLPDANGKAVSGGFSDSSQPDPCKANTFHGFLGIESCAVTYTTDWIDSMLASLPTTRPMTTAVVDSTTQDTPKSIPLLNTATSSDGGALTYSLPHAKTSLGGDITISGTDVNYIPPAGLSGATDTFIYVVDEAGGGSGHNLVKVSLTP